MPGWSKLEPSRRCRALTRVAVLAATTLGLGGCVGSTPACNDPHVARTISTLFSHQLKLTPYVRLIDLDKAKLKVGAIFAVGPGESSMSCVAFVTYEVTLNDAGQRAKGRKRLVRSLLNELAGEKQVYYTISRTNDGRVRVHVDRVGG